MNIFKVKNLGRIWLSYPQNKINPLIENRSFYKRFNLKFIVTSNNNLLTHDHVQAPNPRTLSLLDLQNTNSHVYDFEIPLKGF